MLTRWSALLALVLGATVSWADNSGHSLVLEWTRRGHVADWVVRDSEVFVLGPPLVVYDVETGQERRRARVGPGPMPMRSSSAMAIRGSTLVAGRFSRGEGFIDCFDSETLKLRWERRYPWPESRWMASAEFSVAMDEDSVYVVMMGHPGENLAKLSRQSGDVIWSRHVDAFVLTSPLVLQEGRLLVRSQINPHYPNGYGHYQAVDPATGNTLWRVRIDGIAQGLEDAPLVTDKFAYITSESPKPGAIHFYVIDIQRGAIADHRILDTMERPFAAEGDVLYFGLNTAAAYNLANRQSVWRVKIIPPGTGGANIPAYGVLDRAARRIYLGEYRQDLYVLSATDGTVLDKINIRGNYLDPRKGIESSYGVERMELVGDRLFVGTPDGSLLVFRRP